MSRRKLEISHKYYSYRKLKDIYDRTNDVAMKLKVLAILQTWDGSTSREVAENLHKSHRYVQKWVHLKEELKDLIETSDDNTVILYEDEAYYYRRTCNYS